MGRISERADKFAKELRPQPKEDTRSQDQKLADFTKRWSSVDYLRSIRRKAS